jgi:hypothetical protein
MAVNRWLGSSKAVAKVITLVVGSNTNTHTFITTINGKSLTVTADGVLTTAEIASAIQALLSASDIPEFREVDWTVDSSTVTGTAVTAGKYFLVSESGTGTYTLTTVTASSGPNHADDTGNWSAGTLPAVGEDILIDGDTADILWGLDGITPAVYASFKVKANFEGSIGLPYWNTAGYVEYRTRAWPMATAVPVTIGESDGRGPKMVNISQATALALTVHKTQTRQSPDIPVVNVYGSSSGTLDVISGDVAVGGDDPTQTGTVTTANVNEEATLTVGPGCTVTTLNQRGAEVMAYGTVTTLNSLAGAATLFVAPTTITADGGTVNRRFTGTIATLTLRGQGGSGVPKFDLSHDPRACTITNHSVLGGAVYNDPDGVGVWTNAGTWDQASLDASTLGARFTLLRT